jgi:acetyl esterase/lipase
VRGHFAATAASPALWLAILLVAPALRADASGAQAYREAELARVRAAYQQLDANADGRLEIAEAPELMRGFLRAADEDGDGAVSLAEYALVLDDPTGARHFPIPESVELVPDLPYAGSENPRQQLDLFLPRRRSGGPLPVIAYVHGGAWSMGSRLMARPEVVPLVASGDWAAVSIGYRLSGEVHWPAQIHDVKAALRWVRAHAKQYGLDPARLCAMGASAGGHLAALAGTTNGLVEVEGALGPYTGERSDVACVVDLFGPADLGTPEPASRRALLGGQPSSRELLLGAPPSQVPELARQASPLAQVSPGDAPFLIVHGSDDPLVPFSDSVALERALREAGVPVIFQVVEGGGHGDFAADPEVARRIRLFLDRALRGKGVAVPSDPLHHTSTGSGLPQPSPPVNPQAR